MFLNFRPVKTIGKGATILRALLLPAGTFLLLSVAGLSSSSEADEPLFVHSAQQLERLWGGVLGCTHPGEDDTRPTFETTLENTGAPSAVRHDYAECGKRALRNTSSRMLVNTIEGAVRSGGVALFSERFRLDSSIGWIWREGASGAVDAVIPLLDGKNSDGTGHALFLQPGAVFWQGIESVDRIDANLGIAFRRHFTPDVIGGWSGFYDYDFKRKHRRLGIGMDIQSGVFHTAVNYYYPLNEWQEGRTGYEEQPLEGADLRLGLEWPRIRLDASVAAWRFEGEIDEETKWRPSFSAEAGFHILPGIFLEAGYERQDEDSSIGSQWSTGLAFRFTIPGLDGLNAFEDSTAAPNLFEPVKREKRILYEERKAIPQVVLSTESERIAEGETAVIRGLIGKTLAQDAEVHLTVHSNSTATHGPNGDFTLGHRVFEGETPATGEATTGAADCPASPCIVLLPAGATMFEVALDALADETNEADEYVYLHVDVPDAHAKELRPSGVLRVTIGAHDNTIAFAANTPTVIEERDGTAEVVIDVNLPSPTPVVLNIEAVGGTATEEDYILPSSVTIPTGQSRGMFMLESADDEVGEGDETILLGLTAARALPEGWVLQESVTHRVTIMDDDLAIGFAATELEETEPASGTKTFTVAVELTVSPEEDVTVPVTVAEDSKGFVPADVSYTPTELTFEAGTTELSQDITFTVHDDASGEADEVVEFLINEHASYRTTGGNDFSIGEESGSFTLTIPANDNIVRMGTLTGNSFEEGESLSLNLRTSSDNSSHPAPDGGLPVRVTVTLQEDHCPGEGVMSQSCESDRQSPEEGEDVSFTEEQVIPAGQTSVAFNIDVVNDAAGELAESFVITVNEGANFPSVWGSVADDSATFTIPANDNTIGFALPASRVIEDVSGGVHNIAVDAVLPLPTSAQPVTFNIETNGTANEGTDYSLSAKTVTVNAGMESVNIPVTITNDSVGDPNETIELTLSPASGASLPAGWSPGTATHTVTIVDDETPSGAFSFAGAGPIVPEPEDFDPPTDFTVEINAVGRLPSNALSLVVAVDRTNTTASANDYSVVQTLSNITVDSTTVVGGVLSLDFSVTDDSIEEGDELIVLTLPSNQPGLAGTGWSVDATGLTTYTVTIPANDLPTTSSVQFGGIPTAHIVAFSETRATLSEDGRESATVQLTITPVPDAETNVPILVTGDQNAYSLAVSSPSRGVRYANDTVTFPSNEGTAIFTVIPRNDEDADDELVTVTIGDSLDLNYFHGENRSWRVTIDDTDPPNNAALAPAEGQDTANEGDTLNIPVQLSKNTAADLTFNWTAAPAGEVDASSGTVTVEAGSDSAILPVSVRSDDDPELDKEITVTLSDGNTTDDYDVRSGGSTHRFTVPANDNLVGFAEIAGQTGNLGETGANVTRDVRVRVKEPLQSATDISLALSGTAGLGTDYTLAVRSPATAAYANGTLTLPANEENIDLTVTAINNADDFADEDIVFTLGDPEGNLPEGWAINTAGNAHIHTLTITDDDSPAANTMGFATNGIITEETVANDSCASLTTGPKNCIAVVYQINPGISDSNIKGTLALTASDGSAADTGDIFITSDDDNVPAHTVDLVYANSDGSSGSTEKTIYIHLADDGVPENTEVYTLTASSPPSSHTLVNPAFTITVTDDDIATVGFKETAGTGMESTSGSSMFEIELSTPAPAGGLNLNLALDNTTSSPVYDIVTADASKGSYTQSSGALTINGGETSVAFSGSQTADNDRLNNRYVFTLGEGSSFPERWVINASKDTHTATFTDTSPLARTIGWEETDVTVQENDGSVTIHLKLTDGAINAPFTSAIPAFNFTAGASSAADFTIDIADAGSWTAGTGAVALTAGRSYEDGLVGVRFDITDDIFEEGTQVHTFTIAGTLPSGWEVDDDNKTLTLTVSDDDIPREGGNTIEFTATAGNINEVNRQTAATRVAIDRPNKAQMKFLLTAGPPIEGAAASDADYGLTVASPAAYDAATGIVTLPAGATGFDVSIAAKSDAEDDDFEMVVVTLSENSDAMLPDGWRIGEKNSFTVTIFDSVARPAVTLSKWTRDGKDEGRFAELSSTTEEGGTAVGAVYLTQTGPTPGGIPLVLTVEAGHEDDVTITDYGDSRSAVSPGAKTGTYNFLMRGGVLYTGPNRAALFNINVVDDNMNEPVEVIDISVSKGENFPDGWTLRDDVVYRLTVPLDASESGGEVGFAAESPSVNRGVLIEGQRVERVLEASVPAPRGGLTVEWSAELAAGADASSVISPTSGSVTISEGRRRAAFSFDIADNQIATSDSFDVFFSLTGDNLPGGWSALIDAHSATITDDDLPRTIGGNTIEFAHTAGNVNEQDAQSTATKVLIDRPHRAEMKLLLTAEAPASGSAAQSGDYTFTVRSPANYDAGTGILTLPAETSEFEVEVTAVADSDDDDFEAVALTLKESADMNTGAQLPEGWRIGERSTFTVTILDEDGSAPRPTATLSEWLRTGPGKGRYAQLSSTTAEGGTAPAAIVLTETSPAPDGLNFVLKVEEGYENDVILTDFGDGRSTLVPTRVRGEYLFHMTGVAGNLAAVFNVDVVDDNENEPIEVVDISVSRGANFPSDWTLREDVSYRLTIPRDTADAGGTIGFAESASTVVEGQSGVVRVVEASAPVPIDVTLNWAATVATNPPSGTPPAIGDVISETPAPLTVYKGYRRTEFSFDATDNLVVGLVDPVVTFTLSADSLPEGWTLARPTHTMTIRDDDVTRRGGNLVFFESAAASIDENGLQKVSTRVRIDHPDNARMQFLLTTESPASGAAAGDDDYTFSVRSPAMHDAATNIITIPPGTDSFELEVAARDDTADDDSEVVVFKLSEGGSARLPSGWEIDSAHSSFSVTINDDDGAQQQASATLSQWLREGRGVGRFAQIASTTEEGGTAVGAVYLTQAGPVPEGLNFLLTVEAEHALDVALADYGDSRSMLRASETTAGVYHFHMTGGNLGVGTGTPNLAALFNIHVLEDVQREDEEIVDITLSAGENFPDGWAVREDAVYRLTIPAEKSNVRFTSVQSTVLENVGSGMHNVEVSVRPPASSSLTFTIAHAGTVGPDTAGSGDYSLASNTLTIPANAPAVNFPVAITDDTEFEGDETIVLELSGEVPTGYTLERTRHTLIIEDNDHNTVGFDTASASVAEGGEVNLRVRLEDPAGAAIPSLDRNLPLSIVMDDGEDHDAHFAGRSTLLTPSSTLTDGVFEIPRPVFAILDSELEGAETVTFTLMEDGNFPDNYVIDSAADTFTLTIAANGQPRTGFIQFAETDMRFREPYPGEETGVPQEIRDVLDDGCASWNQRNCMVHYFELEVTGIPEEPFDLLIEKYSETKGNALPGRGFYNHEWGYPTRVRITPEDARDGRIRVPIATARDNQLEETEYWGLELRPHTLPEGWRLGRWDARVGFLDSTGGQLLFAPNDADNGVETFNPSVLNEGERAKVRILANHVENIDTPLSVRIEGYSGALHPDFIGAPRSVTVERYKVWVDMEIIIRDDDIPEGDETYTLILEQGSGWQDYHGRRINPAGDRYTFTIAANDGTAPPASGIAQLSEWPPEGKYRGVFARTSSTTAEGNVTQGAVVLDRPAPEPDGLNLILKIEPGHEEDVFLTNAESVRSSLTPGALPGEYLFNVKSGKVNFADNLAALFNIHVVNDGIVEEEEEIEIDVLPGDRVPYYWTVREGAPYRLTVPVNANDTDNHTIAWETQVSILDEDNTDAGDGIKVKLLIDDPLASSATVGMDVPDTVVVAEVANGAYDAAAQTLTIDAGAGEVTLTIVSPGDITGHAFAALKVAELAGAGALPAGWSVSEGVHTVTVEDDERTLRFARSEVSTGEGESAVVELLIRPPLVSADVSVPFLLVGDADAYSLSNASSFSRSTAQGEERNATATLISNRGTNADSIRINIEALEDSDRFDDSVTFMIDEDNLPEGYAPGEPSVATFTAIDDDKRTVTFIGEDGRTEENSGQAVTIDLRITPPLNAGEFATIPLKVTGSTDAYVMTGAATGGGESFSLEGSTPVIYYAPTRSSGPDSVTLTLLPAYNDDDLVFDLINIEIDREELSRSFIIGHKPSWRIEIPDDQLRKVSWDVDRAVGYESQTGQTNVMVLTVHPPLPPNEGLGFSWHISGTWNLLRDWHRFVCDEWFLDCSVKRNIRLDEVNTGDGVKRGWLRGSNTNSTMRVYYEPAQDSDSWSETVTLTIDSGSLPDGFAVGRIPTTEFFVHDDDR